MSGATYRITTEYLPEESELFPWQARIARLSDGAYVHTSCATTEHAALLDAAAYVKRATGHREPGGVYEADDAGTITPLRPSPTYSGGVA